ncbi:kinesin light chain [Diplodia corticola]|uniref:Kinesin light chain n=1 Tax=Diplodia corticola TaxID=236234 RepID=A0A1J9RZ50_9PEZI|nr:kinesin light chain [Diplodia corticola]OJD33076.1 kinesin light chain [Diplodia corticola]
MLDVRHGPKRGTLNPLPWKEVPKNGEYSSESATALVVIHDQEDESLVSLFRDRKTPCMGSFLFTAAGNDADVFPVERIKRGINRLLLDKVFNATPAGACRAVDTLQNIPRFVLIAHGNTVPIVQAMVAADFWGDLGKTSGIALLRSSPTSLQPQSQDQATSCPKFDKLFARKKDKEGRPMVRYFNTISDLSPEQRKDVLDFIELSCQRDPFPPADVSSAPPPRRVPSRVPSKAPSSWQTPLRATPNDSSSSPSSPSSSPYIPDAHHILSHSPYSYTPSQPPTPTSPTSPPPPPPPPPPPQTTPQAPAPSSSPAHAHALATASRFFASWNMPKAHDWYTRALHLLRGASLPQSSQTDTQTDTHTHTHPDPLSLALATTELHLAMTRLRLGDLTGARAALLELQRRVELERKSSSSSSATITMSDAGYGRLWVGILLSRAQVCWGVGEFGEVRGRLEGWLAGGGGGAGIGGVGGDGDVGTEGEEEGRLVAGDVLAGLCLGFGWVEEAAGRVEADLGDWEGLVGRRVGEWVEVVGEVVMERERELELLGDGGPRRRERWEERVRVLRGCVERGRWGEAREVREGVLREVRAWLDPGGGGEGDAVRRWREIEEVESRLERVERGRLDCGLLHARVCYEMGQYETALEINGATLEGMRAVWGPKHVVTLRSVHLDAAIQLLGGKLKEAGTRCMEALDHLREKLGWNHYRAMDVLNTLVQLYCAEGRWSDAEELATYVVAQNRDGLPESHPQTIESEGNLAEVLDLLGKSARARALQIQVLEQSERMLGPNHPITVLNMARLATMNHNVAAFKETGTLIERFESIMNGLDRARTRYKSITYAMAKEKFGVLVRRHALYLRDEGSAHADKLMTISSKFLGLAVEHLGSVLPKGHSRILSADFERLLTERDSSEGPISEKTLVDLQLLLRKMSAELGSAHPLVLAGGHEMSVTFCLMEKWEEAKESAERTFEARDEILGNTHSDVLQSQMLLAKIYLSLGQLHEAGSLLSDLKLREKKVSSEGQRFDFLEVDSTLASVLSEQAQKESDCDKRKRAVELQVHVLKEREQKPALSDYPKKSLEAHYDLAAIYQRIGMTEKALGTLKELEAKLEGRKEEERPVTIRSKRVLPFLLAVQSDIAAIHWAQRNLREAEEMQLKLLRIHEREYGPDHPDTGICRYNLALTWKKELQMAGTGVEQAKVVGKCEAELGKDSKEAKEMRAFIEN